eukprot:5312402-Prymnesium_polylepis.1
MARGWREGDLHVRHPRVGVAAVAFGAKHHLRAEGERTASRRMTFELGREREGHSGFENEPSRVQGCARAARRAGGRRAPKRACKGCTCAVCSPKAVAE